MEDPKSINSNIYLEVFQAVRQSRIREWDKRDGVFLTVTTGSLALSVSFLTISGFETTVQPNILVWSWVALLTSVILQLLAYVSVDRHFVEFENVLKKWHEEGMDPNKTPEEATTWGAITTKFNYASYFFTITGLVLLVLFGWYNVKEMSDSADGKKFANPIVPAILPTSAPSSSPVPIPGASPESIPSNTE